MAEETKAMLIVGVMIYVGGWLAELHYRSHAWGFALIGLAAWVWFSALSDRAQRRAQRDASDL